MSSTTSPGSDRPSSSDANGGASAHMSRESQYGTDGERSAAGSSQSGTTTAGRSTGPADSHSHSASSGVAGSGAGGYSSSANGASSASAQHSSHDVMHDLAGQAQQLCHDSMESVKSYIAHHPVSSVGIAVAAGCLLSMLMREQSSYREHRHH